MFWVKRNRIFPFVALMGEKRLVWERSFTYNLTWLEFDIAKKGTIKKIKPSHI